MLVALLLSSCQDMSMIRENLPKITYVEVSDITATSAYFEGYFTNLHVRNGEAVTYIMKLSDNADMEFCDEFDLVEEYYELHEEGYYYVSVSSLKPSTEYWYQFVITDGWAEVSSDVKSFRTLRENNDDGGNDDGGNDDGGSTDPDEYTLDEALTLSDGTYVELMGVVAAVTQRGFLLSDDDADMLYVYAGSGWTRSVDVGDEVVVDGTMATFHYNRELSMNDVVVYGSSSVPYTSAYTLTEDNLGGFAWSGHEPLKIRVTGELSYDGTYYNIQVGDSPVIVSLTYPVIDMDYYIGEYVTITGYYIWTSVSSSSETVVSVILTDIDVTDRPGPDPIDTSSASDLNADGETANCYVVSNFGTYKFDPVKGNSSESVGYVASVEVLWESFGTSVTPEVGDLIETVEYRNGHVYFRTTPSYHEGNAVIAAKNSSGTILWSWHIWLTDKPEEQVYYNNAGMMMDRNLGATSATPGNVGALGLLYQWGRKDPFLGSSSISESIEAVSTIDWPSSVSSTSDRGTIDYVIQNPTTYITRNDSNYDWYYTGNSSTDNTRWHSEKTIYDPCPAGWRVPDGGSSGVWSKAVGSSAYFDYSYSATNEGMNFSGKFGNASSIWYPVAGYRYSNGISLSSVGSSGVYWSVTPDGDDAYDMSLSGSRGVFLEISDHRAYGQSVRCYKIGSGKSDADSGTEDMGDSEYEW